MAQQPGGPDLSSGVDIRALAEGAMIAGHVGDAPVVLARSAGSIVAVGGRCTHVGAPLEDGIIADGVVRCPWHHARFDVRTGRAVGAPAFEPLSCFDVEERDGKAFVKARPPMAAPEPVRTLSGPRVVIVGGGAAGFACADWLSRSGFQGQVFLISDDADAPYDRTFCSKDYLEGKAPRSDCSLAPKTFYESDGVDLRLNTHVMAIDLEARTATLDPGGVLAFDVLVLATGGAPKAPTFPGGDQAHLLRTLRDADALIKAAEGGGRAAVVGASFIALETAAALIERGLQVHIIAPDTTLLKAVMGEAVGDFIHRLHMEKGAIFHLGRQVERYEAGRLEISGGMTLEVDFVAAGVGVTLRTELAQKAGIAASDGVVVDERLKTSADGVYAIGDIACYPDPVSGARARVEHWVHAERQGQHVARMIMGETGAFADPPFFWSAHYGTGVRYVGHSDGFDQVEIVGDLEATPATDVKFVARYLRNGVLVAVASYNDDKAVLKAELEFERRLQTPERNG